MFLNILINTISFIVVIGIMIFIHEGGHFLAAKFFKVRVEVFSLGFGKRLWGFKRGDTDYKISLIPLGGYVKLAGEQFEDGLTGNEYEFLSKPRYQRILIFLAGPFMNIIFAILLVFLNFYSGVEKPVFFTKPAVAGYIAKKSPAEKAGVKLYDEILKMGDKTIKNWEDFLVESFYYSKEKVNLTILRSQKKLTLPIKLRESLKGASDISGIYPLFYTYVTGVLKNSPAEKAGIKKGDVFLWAKLNGKIYKGQYLVTEVIFKNPGKKILFGIKRGNKILLKEIIPEPRKEDKTKGMLGFTFNIKYITEKYSPKRAFLKSIEKNYIYAIITYRIFTKVIEGKLSIKQFSGPIEIAKASGEAVKSKSIKIIFEFMALISLSLGLLNLLPFPLLDGGMIFLLIIESIMRKDIPIKLKEKILQLGFWLLITFMLVVIYFDLVKTLGK